MSLDNVTPSMWDKAAERDKYYQDSDPVNEPQHYNNGAIECIDAIEAALSPEEFKGYLKGNCLKYIWRSDYKGKPVEDLRKARWYLEKLIEEVL